MKKKTKNTITVILLMIILLAVIFAIKTKFTDTSSDEGLKTIQLNEVTRSIFYAPQYVAISNRFFEEEGLRLEITTGQGADESNDSNFGKSKVTHRIVWARSINICI